MSKDCVSIPEIEFSNGVPLVPNVCPVILLSGSDYDMGYQYTQQLCQIFGSWILEKQQRQLAGNEITDLKAYQSHLEKHTPEFMDIFRGMAAAAADAGIPVTFDEVLANHTLDFGGYPVFPDIHPAAEQKENTRGDDCSGFAAWGSATRERKLICGASADHDTRTELVVMVLPEKGNKYIYRTSHPATHSIHPGMNNRGLAYVHHGSGLYGKDEPGTGVPDILSAQHTLRFASNADEASEMQLAYPHGIRASGLWADKGGRALVLECRNPQTVRRPGDNGERDFLYVTNNSLNPDLKHLLENHFGWELLYIPHGGWNTDDMNSVRRNLCMWNALHNYHGDIDLDFVKMLWRLPSRPPDYPSLEEAENALYRTKGLGWDTHINNLANGMVGIMQPDDGDKGLYHACAGPAGRQAEPLTAGWHYYPIKATHTFFEIQLAASPVEIAGAARMRAKYDLYDANRELRKLTCRDVPYASLDAIFNQAATEIQKGEYYLGLNKGASGSASVCYLAKAVRAFTRCQAYARQVFESLIPPASKPTDIGLGEWFGEGGKWESYPSR
ncbi:MAG: hypothetical protein PHU23_10120 [Dehalococcoidales bacterium]|nr:hypothetical protein [Dehalococcoidales bacterium]